MSLAKLSSKAQVVLPAGIRRKLGIRPGDTLEIDTKGEAVTIRKAPSSYVDALEECSVALWHGYAEELDKARDQWDS